MSLPRVVSLIASATEMVCALGLEEALVGRSHECDFPASVQKLPVCTAPKFAVEGTSREIDQRVKMLLQDGLSVYRVDEDLLRQLRPDVILTQAQCEVCAVSLRDVEKAVGAWATEQPRVVSLRPNALADVWSDIESVGAALGVPAQARELLARLQERMGRIEERVCPLPDRPTVACIEWIDPLMAAGNWVPELVDRAGGINLFGVAGHHAPWMTWDELRAKDPDVIVIMPCGYDIARSRQDLGVLTGQAGWTDLRAVRDRRVFVADGNQYFNRPGPRLVEALEILAELLHPETFQFGHEGTGWQALES